MERQEGRTTNVSRSGAFFRSDKFLRSGTPVELNLELREESVSVRRLICHGEIVRIGMLPASDFEGSFAARILAYGFIRPAGERRV